MPTGNTLTREQIIESLSQCGNLSYQKMVDFFYSIAFLSDITGKTPDFFISKFTGEWQNNYALSGKYDYDYYVTRDNNIYKSIKRNNKDIPGNSQSWQLIGNSAAGLITFLGVASKTDQPSDTPVSGSFYMVVDAGTYDNFKDANGDSVVLPDNSFGFLTFKNNSWVIVSTPLDLTEYISATDFEPVKLLVKSSLDIIENDGRLCFTDSEGFINAFFDKEGGLNVVSIVLGATYQVQNEDFDFSITDDSGNIVFCIENGIVKFTGLPNYIPNDDYLFVITDKNGWIVAFQDFEGVWHYVTEKTTIKENTFGFLGNIAFVPSLGQSNSVGQGGQNITDGQKYNNIMFNAGLVPQYHPFGPAPDYINDYSGFGNAYTSFVPLVEHSDAETLISGMTELLVEVVNVENNLTVDSHEYKYLSSAPGQGGQRIDQLWPGTHNWDRFIYQMQQAYLIAQSEGKIINMPYFTWWQGEADASQINDPVLYKNNFRIFYKAVNDAAKQIFKQVNDVCVAIIQLQSQNFTNPNQPPAITWAQYELSLENPNFTIIPFYFADSVDNQHYSNVVYRRVGGLAGIAGKRLFIDGKGFKPITIKNCLVQGNVVLLKYDVPVEPLILDTSEITNPGNYGFKILDGTRSVTITSVSISGPNTVKIVSNEPLQGFNLYYGYNGTQGGPGIIVSHTSGMRGNLRDSQGEDYSINVHGTIFKLHNYAPITPAFTLTNK